MGTKAPNVLLCESPSAEQRIQAAAGFLRGLEPRGQALIIAPSPGVALALVNRGIDAGGARFGWHKRTFDGLAAELALPDLAREGLAPVRGLGIEALCTRVVHGLAAERGLGRYTEIGRRPGFVSALARTLDELRLARLAPEQVRPHDADLARLLAAYVLALREAKLCDRAHLLAAAQTCAERAEHPLLRVPLVALDVPIVHRAEAELLRALCLERPAVCATLVRGDERSEVHWLSAFARAPEVTRLEPEETTDLARLQLRLFAPSAAPPAREVERGRVLLMSSPGESREAIEVARALLDAAAAGVPFDRMAVVLRASESYRAVVEEALARAKLPAFFADGVRRPVREGRAFLALLACAREGLSARAFAEYLSLGAMPGKPEPAAPGEAIEQSLPVSPRRWEKLLVDAAVVGGRARWTRRLRGLRESLASERAASDDEARREALAQQIAQLAALESFATPLLDALAALASDRTWGEWLGALEGLARLGLAEPDGVCETLAELAPLGPVGPVSLADVHRLLARRLGSVIVRSAGSGAGKVFVGAIDDVLGRAFDVVFVPGLAEKVFPPRVVEDALLPDRVRRALGSDLVLTDERVARERSFLRVAVGAARERLVLSFPRFDVEHGRPRVPSFYGLEVLQAVDGSLPAFDELTRRAHPGAAARMGWPAPARPEHAIDDAEYDLAVLDQWRAHVGSRVGGARYSLLENPHLARALRFRARRWELPKFGAADGLVMSSDAGRALLASERLSARAYSATALAQFAACPYRFYLQAIARIDAREEAFELDELDARQRGVLFHAVQRAVLEQLKERGMLPLTPDQRAAAQQILRQIFELEVARAREAYAPAIAGVFDAALATVASDLNQWLTQLSEERSWVPAHFELGFGLSRGGELDADSESREVVLESGLKLRGAIDLVEQHLPLGDAKLVLRATDHKTGNPPERLGSVNGGRVLQPLFYALALERLFPGAEVASGRLYYCTAKAGFASHEVALDGQARALAADVVRSIDGMLAEGFLPAAPLVTRERSECEACAYRVICGPYEPERVAQVKAKDHGRLAPLHHLRNLP